MAKRGFQLSEEQIRELEGAYEGESNALTRRRFLAVSLYGSGFATGDVLAEAGCSRPSLMCWCRKYRARGIAGLVDGRSRGGRSKLTPEQVEELRDRLRHRSPAECQDVRAGAGDGRHWTIEDLRRAVKSWYGVGYKSLASYNQIFALCGFGYERSTRAFMPFRRAEGGSPAKDWAT